MGKMKWLVSCAVVLVAANVQAQEKTKAYIAPYAGYTHVRVDSGTVFDEPENLTFDALQYGAAFGFRMPVGFMVEVGRSHAVHAEIFNDHGDFELIHNYGTVGWRFGFADGWHFTPKVGRMGWELSSNHRVFVDDDGGSRHYEIDGWDNFYELNLTRELSPNIAMGVVFQDVDEEFGHTRSGAFTVSFAF